MWAPFNRGRDGCRGPMQWNNQTNAGFTSGKPWNKIHPDYPERNVNAMVHDPNSLLTFYRQLIGLRKQFRCLQVGNLELLDQKNESVLTFTRKFGKEIALIALISPNFRNKRLQRVGSEIIWTKSVSNKTADILSPKMSLRLGGEQAFC
jgi:glycosidase